MYKLNCLKKALKVITKVKTYSKYFTMRDVKYWVL